MLKNHIKLLTREELDSFKKRFTIYANDQFVFVDTDSFKRTTLHPVDKKFTISHNCRKVTISTEAINLWKNTFNDYHLIEVQQAINQLHLMYVEPTKEYVGKILNNEI